MTLEKNRYNSYNLFTEFSKKKMFSLQLVKFLALEEIGNTQTHTQTEGLRVLIIQITSQVQHFFYARNILTSKF